MVWLRIDDNMLDHPKWRRALREGGDGVLAVWVRLMSWCSRNLTDGVVPFDMVRTVASVRCEARSRVLRALADSGLTSRSPSGDMIMTDYLERNLSRQEVLTERSRRSESQRNRRITDRVTGLHETSDPERNSVPSQSHPIPSHPQESGRAEAAKVAPVGAPSTPPVRVVFDEWQRVHGHTAAALDPKRTARIRAALKLHAPEELKLAIRGALKDDWLMGRDPKSPRKYDGLETILRDNAQIERLIDLERGNGAKPRRYGSAQPNLGKTGFETLEERDES